MAKFHSKLPGTDVYHDNDSCPEGKKIKKSNREPGTGGLRRCVICKRR